jgi:iduronate 2-sulfatase
MIDKLLPVLVAGTLASLALAADKPNVLFIAIDDLRPELGCYGSAQVKTPHIDQFASQAMVFTRAYCQVPVCGASRASLFTSVLPTPKRFVSFKSRADADVPGATTLPQAFKNAGYTTISLGKVFHNQRDCAERSWSEPPWRPDASHAKSHDPETTLRLSQRKRGRIYEAPEVDDLAYGDGQTAARAIADLRRLKKAGQPFFLGVGFIRPHLPFYAPKKYWDLYDRQDIVPATNRDRPRDAPAALRGSGEFRSYHLADYDIQSDAWHRMMRHGYMASTSYVDKLVGDVLAELERLELDKSTIIVLWGDHGWHLGEHNFWGKHNTMHLAMRVPLIIKVPGSKNGRCQALVETSDLFPTLCEFAGLAVPKTVQGRSFQSLFDSPQQKFRTVAYSRFGPGDAVITDRFTYTRYRQGRGEMLYDLVEDPQENRNVAADPQYQKHLAELQALLKTRLDEAASFKPPAAEPETGQ